MGSYLYSSIECDAESNVGPIRGHLFCAEMTFSVQLHPKKGIRVIQALGPCLTKYRISRLGLTHQPIPLYIDGSRPVVQSPLWGCMEKFGFVHKRFLFTVQPAWSLYITCIQFMQTVNYLWISAATFAISILCVYV